MLAKISHSFIIAEKGYEEASKYTMLLPDLILSRHNHIGYLIGGQIAENQPPDQNVHHKMSVIHMRRGNQEFLIAEIRLFANWGAPHYHAVFGVRDITT